jgi:Uma2 family endonuclease
MATVPSDLVVRNGYPTSDGKPMAETDRHLNLMLALIATLRYHFAAQPRVYASGNLLLFYERGNRRRHVSPDVFVVRGVPKRERLNYLLWEERRGPQFVIELTSSSTRNEDLTTKYALYRDTLRVREYFLFDPFGDYLDPQLQGHRLRQGQYRPVRAVAGRLPSQVLGLHLEAHGDQLRLFDPVTGEWLPTPEERAAQAEAARQAAEAEKQQEKAARQAAERALAESDAENQRLRQQLEELRNRLTNGA